MERIFSLFYYFMENLSDKPYDTLTSSTAFVCFKNKGLPKNWWFVGCWKDKLKCLGYFFIEKIELLFLMPFSLFWRTKNFFIGYQTNIEINMGKEFNAQWLPD